MFFKNTHGKSEKPKILAMYFEEPHWPYDHLAFRNTDIYLARAIHLLLTVVKARRGRDPNARGITIDFILTSDHGRRAAADSDLNRDKYAFYRYENLNPFLATRMSTGPQMEMVVEPNLKDLIKRSDSVAVHSERNTNPRPSESDSEQFLVSFNTHDLLRRRILGQPI